MRGSVIMLWRLQRFEVALMSAVGIILSVMAVIVGARLRATGYGELCLASSGGEISAGCQPRFEQFSSIFQNESNPLTYALAIYPFAVGLAIGIPLIAREIEQGSTRIAWSLAPSRVRWFIGRAVPALVLVVCLALSVGLSTDLLYASRLPNVDVANSFDDFGRRGILLAAQALATVTVAILAGTVAGRVLPALIVGGAAAAFLAIGVADINTRVTAAEAIVVPEDQVRPGDRLIDQAYQLPDGTLVALEGLPVVSPGEPAEEIPYPIVTRVVPRERYQEVVAREVIVLVLISGAFLGASAFAIRRRRPT